MHTSESASPKKRHGCHAPSLLSRWKIFDNLRRCMVPISLVALLAATWFVAPGEAWLVSLAVTLLMFVPAVFSTVTGVFNKDKKVPLGSHLAMIGTNFLYGAVQGFISLITLAFEAVQSVDAIVRTIFRLFITRRHLLEWQTASDAEKSGATTLGGYYNEMRLSVALTIALGVAVVMLAPAAIPAAMPLIGLWLLAPAFVCWLSRPRSERVETIGAEDILFLREIARRTWRFYAVFVNAEDNWLPPDNFQHSPKPVVASRTSPTNIGAALLSTLAAHDFAFISMSTLVERINSTLKTMLKLERFHGHPLNWYDTRSLQPLQPKYVSTVDSGNLLGNLLTLRGGLDELPHARLLPESAKGFQGIVDTIDCLKSALKAAAKKEPKGCPSAQFAVQIERLKADAAAPRASLRDRYEQLLNLAPQAQRLAADIEIACPDTELATWAGEVVRQIDDIEKCAVRFAPWLALKAPMPAEFSALKSVARFETECSLDAIVKLDEEVNAGATFNPDAQAASGAPALDAWRAAVRSGAEQAEILLEEIRAAVHDCVDLSDMKFEFLYDNAQKLMVIGYNVSDHRIDTSFYDLLASEARLASYICVAQNQVPAEHWFRLGRKLTTTGGYTGLISWSGSMFEYLMPNLLMPCYEGSLIGSTCQAVVARQIEYGASNGIPWGISESGFNARDMQQNYQYRAFGVPGLGFKRGLSEDLVIAPYATVLALPYRPASVCKNLRVLRDMGTLGEYGFCEAVDFTPTRVMDGQKFARVESQMAHHQGMIMLSLVHKLLNQPMQRRFYADPQMKAADLLLQERLPNAAVPIFPHSAEEEHRDQNVDTMGRDIREFNTAHTPMPELQLLSNGRYHVLISNSGAGYSRWKDLSLTRWREDGTCDNWGQFCFIRDLDSLRVWSAAHQPMLQSKDEYHVVFRHSNAEFRNSQNGIVSHMSICVSPEDDVEVRRLKISNTTERPRRIEITTYAEVVLNSQAGELAHPAFSNLFIQTEVLKDRDALLCTRRARQQSDATPYLFHHASMKGDHPGDMSFETDRARFIGRGRSLRDALAFNGNAPLSNTDGSVLDPIFSVRRTITLRASESVELNLVTGIADTREAALVLLAKFQDHRFCERAFEMAWTHSKVILNQLNVTESDAQTYCELAAPILYPTAAHRAAPGIVERNQRGQSGLWGYGISGDFPIVLLRVSDVSGVDLFRDALRAHGYLRMKGLFFDLVVWNDDASTYRQVVHDALIGAVLTGSEAALLDRAGGVYIRRGDQISEDDRVLLQSMARVTLHEGRGRLEDQIERHALAGPRLPKFVASRLAPPTRPSAPLVPIQGLKFFNGLGGFASDGREYVMQLAPGQATPAPWCNVIANADFGTVVTESGGGYTWSENAHEYRLTPWNNDALTDAAGECFYIRDEETGKFWSPTPRPARAHSVYTIRHGFGYSIFETVSEGIRSELNVFVAPDAPVKIMMLTIRNESSETRKLSATGYFEWVLGETRQKQAMHVVTDIDSRSGAVLARNAFNADFNSRHAFCSVNDRARMVTCDRKEFIGRNGSLESPAAMRRARLSGRHGSCLDPCTALQSRLELGAGQSRTLVFILGAARSQGEAIGLVQRFQSLDSAEQALHKARQHWRRMLDTLQVETPDPALDVLLNGWLTYQVLSCRVWARSGFYQSGGAYGFRDQLQDTMSLMFAAPDLAREHLLRSAARQFEEGDVQHWWHPPSGRGVRTQFSDDYLWLPYAVSRYVLTVGDVGVLNERVPFITGRLLKPSQEEAYFDLPQHSNKTATLYEHAKLAITRALAHLGKHGLPLMGCGDWNDGMNLVGIHGKGESVWLAFFLYDVLKQFGDVARRIGDFDMREKCEDAADSMKASIHANGWDGDWYLRAYFDDGSPLGSKSNEECQIDTLPQSWSILSKAGEPERSKKAMESVNTRLVKRDKGLIQLFDPPFDHSALNPGYIKGYVPGVRENGGQYTHGAIWTVMAFAELGEVDRAWELMNMLNPVLHGATPAAIDTYKVEPYVVAADVYAVSPHTGRGGWTWYTGSAGWFYRLGVETLLGIEREPNSLIVKPKLPKGWKGFTIRYRFRETLYKIRVELSAHESCIIVDDILQKDSGRIPLVDDRREHSVTVMISANEPVLTLPLAEKSVPVLV